MKFRIVELKNNKFQLQCKTFLSSWDTINEYDTLEECKKRFEYYAEKQRDKELSKKIKRIVEVSK